MPETTNARRRFLTAGASFASASWIALNWPQVAAAAEHASHAAAAGTSAVPAGFTTLTAAEAVEVDAIANQIVPGGDTPGARDARVVFFIDRSLGTFFAGELPAFRKGLVAFGEAFTAHDSRGKPFSAAGSARQVAWLHEVDATPFFNTVRRLTLLGLVALPKYGGNRDGAGWKLLGFEDRHIWEPPFGHYDKDYPGFEPYPGTRPYGA